MSLALEDLRIDLVPTARGLVLDDLMREVDEYGEVTGNKAGSMASARGHASPARIGKLDSHQT